MLLRFYLMVAIILIAGFSGQWWIAAIGIAIFLSALMGIKFKDSDTIESGQPGKHVDLNPSGKFKRAV